ncbi:MAG: D-alanyl-D-alanine carboxypeptidase family protein [Cellulosilyticaceae bacterium]
MKKRIILVVIGLMMICQTVWATPKPSLAAEGIILIEPKTNTVLVSKNGDKTFYPASITKILTSYILIEEMKAKQIVTKSQNSVQTVPADSSHIGLAVGDQYTYTDGLYGIMLGSDNFIAHDMARLNAGSIEAFSKKMNATAKQMGAYQSHFVNPHGYHDPNHYTTPYDMAQIARVAFDNQTLQKIAGTPTYSLKVPNKGTSIPLKNSAQVIRKDSAYYNPHIVSVKTGYHSKAQQTIVAKAEYENISLIAVVMKTNRPNQYTDLNKLFEYGHENFSVKQSGDGTYRLINHTAAPWAKPYVDQAIQKGWLMQDATNYQEPITGKALEDIMGRGLNAKKLQTIKTQVASCSNANKITRKAFGDMIASVSKEEACKLQTVDGDRAITYQEVICIMGRLNE